MVTQRLYLCLLVTLNVRKILDSFDLAEELNHETVIRSLVKDSLPSQFVNMCHEKAIHIYDRKPAVSGRIELLNYLTEQNFSYNYHRYGNLLGEEV